MGPIERDGGAAVTTLSPFPYNTKCGLPYPSTDTEHPPHGFTEYLLWAQLQAQRSQDTLNEGEHMYPSEDLIMQTSDIHFEHG